MSLTPRLSLSLLDPAQAQKETTINADWNLIDASVTRVTGDIMTGGLKITRTAVTVGNPNPDLWVVAPADTGMTASTEATDVTVDCSATRQFATGALTTQRAVRVLAPTYSFVGASTLTNAYTVSISGSPVAGTNATITNSFALNVDGNGGLPGGVQITAPSAGRCLTLNSGAGATIKMVANPGTQRSNILWGTAYQFLSDLSNSNTADFGIQNLGTGNLVLQCSTTDLITLGSAAAAGGAVLGISGGKAGFYGVGTPVAKQTVTGSKAGNAALASLLTALAALGLVTDTTT